MFEHSEIICFHCGQPAGDPLAVNQLDDETPCPACAERMLAALPSLLPSEAEEWANDGQKSPT